MRICEKSKEEYLQINVLPSISSSPIDHHTSVTAKLVNQWYSAIIIWVYIEQRKNCGS